MKRTLLIGAALAGTFAAAAPAAAHYYGGYGYRAPVVRHVYRPVAVRPVYRAPAYYTYPAYRYGYPRFHFSVPGFYFAF